MPDKHQTRLVYSSSQPLQDSGREVGLHSDRDSLFIAKQHAAAALRLARSVY